MKVEVAISIQQWMHWSMYRQYHKFVSLEMYITLGAKHPKENYGILVYRWSNLFQWQSCIQEKSYASRETVQNKDGNIDGLSLIRRWSHM